MNPTDRPDHGARLRAERLTLGYADRTVVRDVDLAFPDGQVTAIVGANACGKSTLLRGLARLLHPAGGAALLDGHDLHRLPTREVAKQVGLLPQAPLVPEGVTVADLVSRGRHPHQGLWRRWSAADEAAVAEALALTDTGGLAHRPVDELSGGQRQRVWLAVALAQETELLLLDEPTTYLDLAHQIAVLDLLRDLNRTRGTTLVMVLHDLGLAARYADHVVALREGQVHCAGSPQEVGTEEMVHAVLGLEARVVPDPVCGTPLIVPVGRHRPVPALTQESA